MLLVVVTASWSSRRGGRHHELVVRDALAEGGGDGRDTSYVWTSAKSGAWLGGAPYVVARDGRLAACPGWGAGRAIAVVGKIGSIR